MRRLLRSWYIFWTMYRFGLGELVVSAFPSFGLRFFAKLIRGGRSFKEPRGVRLRKALEQLGPIFVKFGQLLSTRRDLIPIDIANELALLQDRVEPFDSKVAFQIIEEALGKKIGDLFVSIEPAPCASASISQVYFAVIKAANGVEKSVAVKVLRPKMKEAIEQDLRLLRTMAGLVDHFSRDGKRLKPKEVVAEFDKHLNDELDLLREASSAAQLRRNMANLNLVMIPEIYWDYCAENVMVMERMNGVPISQVDTLGDQGVDAHDLARNGIIIFFTQVFCDGFFHADMHPGNILVSLERATLGRYILLDFGIVGSLTENDKEYLAQNFAAFFRRDYRRVAELHIESGWVPVSTRVDELEAAIRGVCEPYFDRPLREISLGMVLLRLFQASRRFHVEIQPQLVLLQKTLLNVEGLARELDPDLDLWATAKPFLDKWMRNQIGPKRFLRELRNQAPHYAKLLPDLPYLAYSYLKRSKQDSSQNEVLLALVRNQRVKNQWLIIILCLILGGLLGALFTCYLFNG